MLSEHKWYSVTSWCWVSTSDILLQADVAVSTSDILLQADVEWAQVIFCYKLMLLWARVIFCYKLMLSEHKWYSVTSWCCCEHEWYSVTSWCWVSTSDILLQADVAVSHKWYSVTSRCCCESQVIFCYKQMLLWVISDVLLQADVAVCQKWYSVTSWCCCVKSDTLLQADVAVSQKYCCFFAAEPCSSVRWPQPWRYFGTEPPALRTGQYCPLLVQQQKILSHDFSFGFKTAHGIQKMSSFFSVSFSIDVIWVFRSAIFQSVVDASKISSMDQLKMSTANQHSPF